MIDREMVISCTTSMGAALSGLSVIPLCLIVGKRKDRPGILAVSRNEVRLACGLPHHGLVASIYFSIMGAAHAGGGLFLCW